MGSEWKWHMQLLGCVHNGNGCVFNFHSFSLLAGGNVNTVGHVNLTIKDNILGMEKNKKRIQSSNTLTTITYPD